MLEILLVYVNLALFKIPLTPTNNRLLFGFVLRHKY